MGAEWNRVIDSTLLRLAFIATGFSLWLVMLVVVLVVA